MTYAQGMSRRQVLVQLDDDLVNELDALASSLGTNRSELIRQGARALLIAHARRTDDRRLIDSYSSDPLDPDLVESAHRLAARTAPAW